MDSGRSEWRGTPRITSHKISHNGFDYELNIGFSYEALLENSLAIDIVARRTDPATGRTVEAPGQVAIHLTEMRATISVGDIEIGAVDLADLDIPGALNAEEALRALERAAEGAAERFGGLTLAEGLEEALNQFPVLDPFFGCMLKAGFTSTLGQVMRCHAEVGQVAGWRKARHILACLADNVWDILGTATRRAFRCMVMFGFG